MTKVTLSISDELADRLEDVKQRNGFKSLDAAAEALMALGLYAAEDDDDLGLDTETLQALIDEAEASGPAKPWNSQEVFAEIRARYAANK